MSKKETTNKTNEKSVKTYTKKQVILAILPWFIIYTLVLSATLIISMWFYTCNSMDHYDNQVQSAAKAIVESLK